MGTVTVELSEDQVVQLVEQLSPSAKEELLKRLILQLDFERWEAMTEYGTARMRELCAERDIDWQRMTEDERLQLVDIILHEA